MAKPLDVQQFLETKTFGQLEDEWGVCARVASDGHKFALNYDMVLWTPGHVPSEQCRGLVLGLELAGGGSKVPNVNGKPDRDFCPGKTVIYGYPMDKFYNSEETHAANIDWTDPKLVVEDKLDGTLCTLYWDAVTNTCCVSTRSVPDADLPVDGWPEMTFRRLFEDAVLKTTGLTFQRFVSQLPKCYTYCFELTGPYNRIMVKYDEPGITFLAVRDNFDLRERSRETARMLVPVLKKVPGPMTWQLQSYSDVKTFVDELSPTECEGAVVVTGTFQRIKIKSAKWIVANATKTTVSASPRNLVRYIIQGVDDDINGMLPEDIQGKIQDIKERMQELFKECDENFRSWKATSGTRKEFAELVSLHEGWHGPYFPLFDGKSSTTNEYVSGLLKADRLTDVFIDGILRHVGVVNK